MPRKSSIASNAASDGWSTSVDDFALWDEDDEGEVRNNSQPLLHSANRAHTESQSTRKTPHNDDDRVQHHRMQLERRFSSTAGPSGQESKALNELASSSKVTVIHNAAKEATPPITSCTPWQYTKQKTLPSVPSLVQRLPISSSTKKGTASRQNDALPQYAYRKPLCIRAPSQQTIRVLRPPLTDISDQTPARGLSGRQHERSRHQPYPRSVDRSSSRSSSSSCRLFDTASSSSSRTITSSSPSSSKLPNSDKASASSSYLKSPAPSQPRPSPKQLALAQVIYRRGNTAQTHLGFRPIQRPPSQGIQSPLSSPSEGRQHENYMPQPVGCLPSSSSSLMLPPLSTPAKSFLDGEVLDYQSHEYGGGMRSTSYSHYSDLHTPSISPRSALDEAVNREFLDSLRNTTARARIASNCQTTRDDNSSDGRHTRTLSEEKRRELYYNGIFNTDPVSHIKRSQTKLMKWASAPKDIIAKQRNLLSMPLQGAASKRRSKEIWARMASQSVQQQSQYTQPHQSPPKMYCSPVRIASRSTDCTFQRPISISSESSDEFECDFDMRCIQEEDLVRLEASK